MISFSLYEFNNVLIFDFFPSVQYKRKNKQTSKQTNKQTLSYSVSSVQSLSRVRLFATPWIAARQASLSITNSRSSFRLASMESVMPFSHLILCRPLLLLPPIPPSIKVFLWPSNSTFRHVFRENHYLKGCMHSNINHSTIYSLITARTWKQPKCPATVEWIKQTRTYVWWNIAQP